jgi:hypothetical protein
MKLLIVIHEESVRGAIPATRAENVCFTPHLRLVSALYARVKSEQATIVVTDGLRQDAVHSTLLFCATIAETLRQIGEFTWSKCAYHDDMYSCQRYDRLM